MSSFKVQIYHIYFVITNNVPLKKINWLKIWTEGVALIILIYKKKLFVLNFIKLALSVIVIINIMIYEVFRILFLVFILNKTKR